MLCFFVFVVNWARFNSLGTWASIWAMSYYVTQADLKLMVILLPHSPKCWIDKYELPYPAKVQIVEYF